MRDIVQIPDPVLRRDTVPVSVSEITTKKIRSLIDDMKAAIDAQDDAVAIAAPQVGESLQIFVVAKRVNKKFEEDLVFINPEIIRLGKKKEVMQEGCLSVRWKYGEVKRATTATIRALNEHVHEFVISARGLLAQIFQHETDHLKGVLFIDTAKNIEDIPPQK
jgi:peptide deformylase